VSRQRREGRDAPEREQRESRERRALHLSDYLAVLRQRPIIFWLVFLAVFGGLTARALLTKPVYLSFSTLQVEDQQAAGGLLGDLKAMESGSTTVTEIEIMRSRTVALGAARKLPAGVYLVEENAYRPLEVLLGSVTGRPVPCTITLDTSAPKPGKPTETYVFDFGAKALAVERHTRPPGQRFGGEVLTEVVGSFESGKPFTAFGRKFTLQVDGPAPTGRRYRATLRSLLSAAGWIRRGITVAQIGSFTGVVKLGFETETPRLARQVAVALADSYLELKGQQRRTQVEKALEFLGEEIAAVKARLKKSEHRFDKVRSDSDAVLLSDRAAWIVEKESDLELQRAEQQVVLEGLKRLLAAAASAHGTTLLLQTLEGGRADPMTAALSEQLARLELERDGMLEAGYRAEYPPLRAAEAGIRTARARLRSNLETGLKRRIEVVELRIEHLEKTTAAYEKEARALPETERKIAEIAREVRANLKIFDFLVEKEREAQLARASTLATVRRIDEAFKPGRRESPKLFVQALLGLMVGVFVAVLFCFFLGYLDRSIRSPQLLVEQTGLPLYAAIPSFRSVRGRSLRGLKGMLVTRDRPASMLAEAYRTLLTNLRFASLDAPVRTLAITSALPSEGKTVTLTNLAVAAASLGDRVIIIDADLRRPATHKHFGVERSPGLSELLSGGIGLGECMRDTDVENLWTIPAGKSVSNPGSLLHSEGFDMLLEQLRNSYDWVFVDMPPILAVADPSAFIPKLDAVLLAVRYGARSLEAVRDARDQIKHVGGNLLGLVFNALDLRSARRRGAGYSGYYGYYGRYGGYGGSGYYGEETEEPVEQSVETPDSRGGVSEAVKSGQDGPEG